MAKPPGQNPVAAQYEKWVYPLPVPDLSAPEEKSKRAGGDFGRNWHTFWPSLPPREDLDILVAGCGSTSAARYAFHHPEARVVGIDLSAASLAHQQFLKDKHGLANLALHQGRLEEVASFGQTFDFIDCSGVLHHLPDPVAGLTALRTVLRQQGTIAIMLYGAYARAGFYMLRRLLQVLEVGQSESDVAFVRHAIDALPDAHVVRGALARTQDVTYDAGLVDTFLHPQDRAYTVPECLDLVAQAGLRFQAWWDNVLRYPEGQLHSSAELYQRIHALPDAAQWEAMELYNGMIGQHTFAACLPDRPRASTDIDFSGDAFLAYVPLRRSKQAAHNPDGTISVQRASLPAYPLNATASALYQQIDGMRTVRECFASAGLIGNPVVPCREAFQFLWRLGYVFVRLPPA